VLEWKRLADIKKALGEWANDFGRGIACIIWAATAWRGVSLHLSGWACRRGACSLAFVLDHYRCALFVGSRSLHYSTTPFLGAHAYMYGHITISLFLGLSFRLWFSLSNRFLSLHHRHSFDHPTTYTTTSYADRWSCSHHCLRLPSSMSSSKNSPNSVFVSSRYNLQRTHIKNTTHKCITSLKIIFLFRIYLPYASRTRSMKRSG